VSRERAARRLRVAVALVAALVLLEAFWEMLLAPLRPGGSWLALKALPLALLWPRLARADRRAGQWATLALPFYFGEALVRAATETGRHALVAGTAALLAAFAFAALLAWFRAGTRD
jgi:uncharacterized membrane protein